MARALLAGISAPTALGWRFLGFLTAVMLLTPAPLARAETFPLSALPQFSSNPSASNKIYLNFTGDTIDMTGQWWNWSGEVPAYDMDGDRATFTLGELVDLQRMWKIVAEAFSPFNVDVTTADPGNSHLTANDSVKVCVGGWGTWVTNDGNPHAAPGGFCPGFSGGLNPFPQSPAWMHVAYAFSDQISPVTAPGVWSDGDPAEAQIWTDYLSDPTNHAALVRNQGWLIAHETGHLFGLDHQRGPGWEYGLGTYREYDWGYAVSKGPIMGLQVGKRIVWGVASDSYPPTQDDVATIMSTANGIQPRPDDHGNIISAATPLSANGTDISGSGIIESLADKDIFSFTTPGGWATIRIAPIGLERFPYEESYWDDYDPIFRATGEYEWIGMLDAKVELFDADNNLLASGDHAYSWDWLDPTETISMFLPAGTYYLAVESQGVYGDLGQYEITGTLVPEPATLTLLALGGLALIRRRRK